MEGVRYVPSHHADTAVPVQWFSAPAYPPEGDAVAKSLAARGARVVVLEGHVRAVHRVKLEHDPRAPTLPRRRSWGQRWECGEAGKLGVKLR